MTRCPSCRRELPIDSPGTVKCICGTTFTTTTPFKPKPICIHRLPVIGFADCKCDGKPDVFGCSLHTYCMPRPIRNGKQLITLFSPSTTSLVTMNYCNKCKDFQE